MNTTFLKRIAAGALAMMLSMAALPLSAAAQEEPVALVETDVTLDQTEFTYTGSEIRPNVTVRSGENLLTLDTHYTLELRDNVEVGQGLVVVTGVEAAGYTGTVEHPFTIVAAEAEPVEIQGTDVWMDGTDFPYTGKPITPAITVTVEGKTLVQDTDYTVTYQNNVEPGTAEAVVQGMGDYTGTVEMPFTIQQPQEPEQPPVELTKENVSLEGNRFPYKGKPITPAVTVTADGKTLAEGSDYTLTYRDNEKPGTATVTVEGKGGYTGKVTLNFTIFELPKITKGDGVTWRQKSNKDLSFTTNQTERPTAVQVDGKKLSEGDYTVKGEVVTLKAGLLSKLALGKHTLTLSYADGEAKASFQVAKPQSTDNPATGDSIHLWTAVLFISATASIGLGWTWKKQLL